MGTRDESYAVPASAASMPQLPRPPSPSADRGIVPGTESSFVDSGTLPNADDIDIFTLSPLAALRMLCSTVETLVRLTGDIPPTPPISHPKTPSLGLIQAEKENVARHTKEHTRRRSGGAGNSDDLDGVPARAKTPTGSREAGLSEPLHVVGSNMEPLNTQHGAITRKFYSKRPPPISLEEYLMRLHCFCPMSTAVYLATSLYIHKLAVVERIIPVTSRNVHRLVLAGLRVAMKALEDFSYPHRRFAKVGGVSETELGKLEVSFCFVTNFELRVDKEGLLEHAKCTRNGTILSRPQVDFQPQLPPSQNKRDLVVGHSKPRTAIATENPAAA
ncbi:MAG: hypothetical protein ASARMPRED_007991 [Alectoria sarmentosa]|nr:MAG: hypothetical protein ASARMPRED_007991 [Alectoria sarmentosa]